MDNWQIIVKHSIEHLHSATNFINWSRLQVGKPSDLSSKVDMVRSKR